MLIVKQEYDVPTILGCNAAATGNPCFDDKILGVGIGRGLEALKGLRHPVISESVLSQKIVASISGVRHECGQI